MCILCAGCSTRLSEQKGGIQHLAEAHNHRGANQRPSGNWTDTTITEVCRPEEQLFK